KDELRLIEVDTFNGANLWRYLGPGNFSRLGDPLSGVEKFNHEIYLSFDPMVIRSRKFNEYGFRLWMMLPFSRLISDLVAEKNPWRELEKEGPYLDLNVTGSITGTPKQVDTREFCNTWDGTCPDKQ